MSDSYRPFVRPCASVVFALTLAVASVGRASILFDATKAQQAGNADWVIDETSSSTTVRTPSPAQSGITAGTTENYWTGGISAWGVTMAKRGQTVETLPEGTAITYGTAAAQDLKNYTTYAVVEPNNLFTAAEKTALINYVKNGGSLFMVSDHGSSDRDGDGKDSVDAWNDFIATANTGGNAFNFTFNGDSVGASGSASSSSVVDSAASDPITHGAAGTASHFYYASGSTITVASGATNVKIAAGSTNVTSLTTARVIYGTYGLGRFVAVGDSSPFDDGTGASGDSLFNGWSEDTNGAADTSDATLITNATLWLNAVPEPTTLAVIAVPAWLLGRRRRV